MPDDDGSVVLPVRPEVDAASLAKSRATITGSFTDGLGDIGKKWEKAADLISNPITLGVTAVVAAGGALYKLGSTFDEQFDKIQTATGATGKQLSGLEDSFKNVVKRVPVDFDQASTAVGKLASSTGLSGKALEGMSGQVLNLTRITGGDLNTNLDRAAGLMKDWKLPAEQAAGSLDVLFKASQNSGVGFDELAGQMDKFGPTMRGLGLTYDQGAGLLAKLEKNGVDAGAVLKGMSKDIIQNAKDLQKAQTDAAKADMKVHDLRQAAMNGTKVSADKMAEAVSAAAGAHESLKMAEDVAARGAAGMKSDFEASIESIKGAKNQTEAMSIAMHNFGAKTSVEFVDSIRSGKLSVDDLMSGVKGAQGAIQDTADSTDDGAQKMQLAWNNVRVALEPLASAMFNFGTKALTAVADGLVAVSGYVTKIIDLFHAEGFKGVIDKLAGDWAELWPKIKAKLGDLLTGLGSWIVESGPGIAEKLGQWALKFYEWEADMALKLLAKLGDWIRDTVLPWIGDQAPKLLAKLGDWTVKFLAWAGDMGLQLLGKLGEWIVNTVLPWIGDQGPKLLEKLGEWTLKFIAWETEMGIKLLEALGAWLLTDLLPWIVGVAPKILEKLGEWTAKFLEWVVDLQLKLIGAGAGKLLELITGLLDWIGGQAAGILTKLGDWTGSFIGWVPKVSADLVAKAADLIRDWLGWMGRQPEAITSKLVEWTTAFTTWVTTAAGKIVDTAVEHAEDFFKWMATVVTEIPKQLVAWSGAFTHWVTNLGGELATFIGTGAASIVNWIGTQAANLPAQLVHWTTAFVTWMTELPAKAAAAIAGLGQAIGEVVWNWVKDRVSSLNPFGGGGVHSQAAGGTEPTATPAQIEENRNQAIRSALDSGESPESVASWSGMTVAQVKAIGGKSGGTGGGAGLEPLEVPAGHYTPTQIAQLAERVGFSKEEARIVGAIGYAESTGNPDAIGDVGIEDKTWGPSVGLMQVRSQWADDHTGHTRDQYSLKSPLFNMESAWAISGHGKTFTPWSTYTTNDPKRTYKNWLGAVDMSKLARGGHMNTAGWAWVGEQGAELAWLPKGAAVYPQQWLNQWTDDQRSVWRAAHGYGGGQVSPLPAPPPAPRAPQMFGGTDPGTGRARTVTINNYGLRGVTLDEREMMKVMDRAERLAAVPTW